MNFRTRVPSLIVALLFFLVSASSVVLAQKRSEITVVGTVIGVEVPEMGWPMEFEDLKIFYLRVDKVEKGKLAEKYLRVAYGHNPSSRPASILPDAMFESGSQWRFRLSSWDEFDSTVIVSREVGDWVDNAKSTKVKGSELGMTGTDAEKDFTSVPLIKKCVPVKGFEDEAISLEKLGKIKGYWLSFEDKKGYERVKTKKPTSPKT